MSLIPKNRHVNLVRQAAAKGLQTGLKPKKAKAKAKSKVKSTASKGAWADGFWGHAIWLGCHWVGLQQSWCWVSKNNMTNKIQSIVLMVAHVEQGPVMAYGLNSLLFCSDSCGSVGAIAEQRWSPNDPQLSLGTNNEIMFHFWQWAILSCWVVTKWCLIVGIIGRWSIAESTITGRLEKKICGSVSKSHLPIQIPQQTISNEWDILQYYRKKI